MPETMNSVYQDMGALALYLAVIAWMVVGFFAVWCAAWCRLVGLWDRQSWVPRAVSVSGVVAMISGLYLLIALLIGPVCIVWWLVLTLILLAAYVRYLRAESRALAAMLTAAAERGVPLEAVAHSYAVERQGLVARRAERLADYLRAAVPVSIAMRRSGAGLGLFPPEMVLAAEIGERSGTLGKCMRSSLDHIEDLERTQGSVWEKLLYVGGLLLVMVLIMTFVMIKIVPVFAEMFADFGMELPAMTETLIDASRLFVGYWYLFAPLAVIVAVIAVNSMLGYVGLSSRSVPLVHRLFTAIDNAMALRMLALTVSKQRPVVDGLYMLAACFPLPAPRRRLERAAQRAQRGEPWYAAMQASQLIRAREAAVLKAAQGVDNLPWALEELARNKVRRWSEKIRFVTSLVFPLAILAVGLCVMFCAVALMMPLFALIQGLT